MAKRHTSPTIFDNIDFPPYEFVEFPKYMYKKADNAEGFVDTLVGSASDERALGKGWYNTPTEARNAPALPAPQAPATVASK